MSFLVQLIGQNVPTTEVSDLKNIGSILKKEMSAEDYNFSSFASRVKVITSELLKSTPDSLEKHPDFGILPPNTPCSNCYELLDKRETNKRQYVKYGENGALNYYQTAYDSYNYYDNNGWLRALDVRLYPTNQSNVYSANNQPAVTKVDLNQNHTSIYHLGKEVIFNKNLKLSLNINGNNQYIASANWTNSSVGNDGVKVVDIFPGIDAEIVARESGFKTNFIVKSDLNLIGDYLVIEDDFNLPINSSYNFSAATINANGLYEGQLFIENNSNNSTIFEMVPPTVYDDSSYTNLLFKANSNKLELYIPLAFINSVDRTYPIIIDPLLTASSTTPQATVRFSGILNNGLFTNACSYFMNVTVPAAVQVTDIIWQFDYLAQNGAALCHGGLDFDYSTCRSPSIPTQFWFCNTCLFAGTCGSGAGISMFTHFSSCIPSPQCATYIMPFTLNFYERARINAVTCSSFYITSNSNWTMTVEGRTVQQTPAPTSSAGTSLCNFASTNLTATGSFGVPPYSYSWTPGPIAGNPINITPPISTSTTYTCTITDACGITSANSISITTSACLPIKLTSFDAEVINNEIVELKWVTETEVNNNFFTLERSSDGINFENLFKVDGAGNSNVTLSYQKNDSDPLLGTSYYRLKQTDFNGDYEYSNIISVTLDRNFDNISIYPNPLDEYGYLTFNSKIDGYVKVEIMNIIGEKIHEKKYDTKIGSNKIKFSSKKMTQGVYFFKISNNTGTSSFKIAKN